MVKLSQNCKILLNIPFQWYAQKCASTKFSTLQCQAKKWSSIEWYWQSVVGKCVCACENWKAALISSVSKTGMKVFFAEATITVTRYQSTSIKQHSTGFQWLKSWWSYFWSQKHGFTIWENWFIYIQVLGFSNALTVQSSIVCIQLWYSSQSLN